MERTQKTSDADGKKSKKETTLRETAMRFRTNLRNFGAGLRKAAGPRRRMQRRATALVTRATFGQTSVGGNREMYKQHSIIGLERTSWCRWCALVTALLIAAPVIAREQIVLQKSGTDPQARGEDATLKQASPNSNNVGNTLTVSGVSGANQNAILEFDLSRIPNVGVKAATLTLNVVTAPSASVTYGAYPVSDFWQANAATWNTRVATTIWTTPGGDASTTATGTATVKTTSTTAAFSVTGDVQNWYNGSANYGWLIKDQSAPDTSTTVFGSKEASNATSPELTVQFVQNVTGLTATPGNASVTLNWTIPALIGTPVGAETYTGVVILRRAGSPVDKSSNPTDKVNPTLCSTLGTGTVVFNDSTGKTQFIDNASDTCGAPANGTTYFYKVFLRDSSNYYSYQPITNGSTYTGRNFRNSRSDCRRAAEHAVDRCNVRHRSRQPVADTRVSSCHGIANGSLVFYQCGNRNAAVCSDIAGWFHSVSFAFD